MNAAQAATVTASAPEIDQATRLNLYRTMMVVRAVEKRAYDLFMQNLIKGTSHQAPGQEAIAAGFGVAMRPDDYTFCTYRGHAHTLVRCCASRPRTYRCLRRTTSKTRSSPRSSASCAK